MLANPPPPPVGFYDFIWMCKGGDDVLSHSFCVTLVCSFPDVQADTSALDAYRRSRCGCTCTILSKVCPLASSSREQRHWIPSVEPCCPSSSSPAPLPLSPPFSQVVTQPDAHCAHRGVIIGTLCFYCLQLFCWSNSMSFSLSLSLPSSSCTLSFSLHPRSLSLPMTSFSLLHPPPPPPPSLFVAFLSPHQVSQ